MHRRAPRIGRFAAAMLTAAAVTTGLGGLGCGDDGGDGGPFTFTGELVDWDSTDQMFRGIADAVLTDTGDPGNTATTAPNGRATLMLDGASEISITADGYLPIRFTAVPAAFPDGAAFSTRSLTFERRNSFFLSLDGNLAPQPGTGEVLVEVTGAATVTLDDSPSFWRDADGEWSPGATTDGPGHVLFVNVAPGDAAVGATGGCVGPASLTVAADEIAATTFRCS